MNTKKFSRQKQKIRTNIIQQIMYIMLLPSPSHHKICNAPYNFNATTRHKGDISSNWPVVVKSVVVSVCEKARTKFNVHINIVNDMKHATKLMEFYSEKFSNFFRCLFFRFMQKSRLNLHLQIHHSKIEVRRKCFNLIRLP